MTRWQKEQRLKRAFIIAVAFVIALVVTIPAYGYYKEVIAKEREAIATVNGKPFRMDSYAHVLSLRQYQMDAFLSSLSQQSGNESAGNALSQQILMQRASLPSTVVTEWVNGEVIALAAPKLGIVVSGDEVAREMKRQLIGDPKADVPVNEAARDADAKEQLKRLGEITGIKADEYRRIVEVGLLQQRVDKQLRDQIVTPTLQVRVQAILTSGEQDIQAAYKRVQEGEDFAKVAQEVSLDPQSKENGGELGWVPKGLRSVEFDRVVFALSPGQMSEPFETSEGNYIVRVLERDEARDLDTATLDQVKAGAMSRWLNEEKKNYNIAYYISSDKQFWAQDRIDKDRAKKIRNIQQPIR